MRIATYNVNGINGRLTNLLGWLEEAAPDVVCDQLAEHAEDLLATGEPVVLAGDYNVMPTDLDVYAPERGVDDALFRPEVRDAYRRVVEQGWTDALGPCIRESGSTHFGGSISGTPSAGTRGCVSIICCSPRRWRNV